MRKLILLALFLTGCVPCRFAVMADYARAVEERRNCRIIVYEISPIIGLGYTGHAELECEGEFTPTYPMAGRVARFSGKEWLDRLRDREFRWEEGR